MSRQVLTIYCDEPSHAPDPVGLFVRGTPDVPMRAGHQQIELSRQEGVYIITMMKRDNNSRLWVPHMRNVTGLSRRGGGMQKVAQDSDEQGDWSNPFWRLRYRLKCDECDLTNTVREPAFSDKLTALAQHGLVAISLRALVSSGTQL